MIFTHRLVCDGCGLEIMEYEDTCPRCGSTNFDQSKVWEYSPATDGDVQTYMQSLFAASDAFISSEVACLCGGNHYSVFPCKRDPGHYDVIKKITILPYCPERVWQYATKSKIPRDKFVGGFEWKKE